MNKRNSRISLTKEQKEIIFGTLLGDGYLNKRGNHVRLQLNHGPKQEEYIKWKAKKLHNILTPRGLKKEVYNDKWSKTGKVIRWNFYTTGHEYLAYLHSIFYSDKGKKLITEQILDKLTPLSLYVWMADDGNLTFRKSKPNKNGERFYNSIRFRLSSCSKDGKLEDLIVKKFKEKFDLDCRKSILNYKNKRVKNTVYIVTFNSINTSKLINIVKPYVSGNMNYKFDISKFRTKVPSCNAPTRFNKT